MAKLVRKHVIVDAAKLSELARRRGTSESEAVRQAVEHALAADEFMAAVRELHDRGAIDDTLDRLPDEAGDATSSLDAIPSGATVTA